MTKNDEDRELVASINAERLVVQDIFCNDYLFTIPNYQRPYSWEDTHCTQLLNDLHTFAFKETDFNNLPPYFLGSAVIIKKPNKRDAQIVDGQQRLTTLTILLSCLRYCIVDEQQKTTISSMILQEEDKLKGTKESFRLKTRDRDQDFFKKLIQEKEGLKKYFSNSSSFAAQNDAQELMLNNSLAILEEFKKKGYTQEQLTDFAAFIIQKCVIVIVASTEEDMAFRIFNVLNDRGKDLTISDILKSEVLERVPKDEQDTYTEKWENCETILGTNNFKDLFSHLRAIYTKRKAELSVLVEIREFVKPAEQPAKFIDEVLAPFSYAYNNILKQNFKAAKHAEKINVLFGKLKRVSHADWIPSAIFYVAKYNNDAEKIYKFLTQLENVTLGMEGMRLGLNERIERYGSINLWIEHNKDLFSAQSDLMLSEKDGKLIINVLTTNDVYRKGMLKPVLTKIEEQMNDGSITINYDALNIEHVLPQTPTDEYWTSRFNLDEQINWTNKLGNLSLISVRKNAQASNYDYNKKINIYFKADGKASNLAMVNALTSINDWNVSVIENRNRILLNHFLNAIGLKPIE